MLSRITGGQIADLALKGRHGVPTYLCRPTIGCAGLLFAFNAATAVSRGGGNGPGGRKCRVRPPIQRYGRNDAVTTEYFCRNANRC